ncbi:SRPBCC family protein [Streptomyces sp. AV19]|uniref:SRPBCC family protein n=1 Tax=Streptomyces sp. AV19 TaxID=2793068 RepID=UPI0018FE618A|nr:SRPBCC family protein [Streptomyces sp. AV19]MBH1933596.1 SRPBCC family protein [Streptomyces sp. AV19]MDG4535933.1 SRPBCC family protein [Streptomyces sp. AV19]
MSYVLGQINAAHREINSYPVSSGEGRSLLIRRTYDACIEDVWDACTRPSRIGRWLAPVRGDFRVGGAFEVEGNASGRVLRCERPRLLKVTWDYGLDAATEVEVRLSPAPGGSTVFELRHASPSELVDELVRTEGLAGAVRNGAGWDLVLLGLDVFLHDDDLDRAAWRDTPQVREFTIHSYRAWGDASRAAWGVSADDMATVVESAVRHVTCALEGGDR